MSPIQIIFLIIVTIPFIEIYLLLQVGGIVGVFPTIRGNNRYSGCRIIKAARDGDVDAFTRKLGAWRNTCV